MDLSKLDTKRASDEGAWLELRHPATGQPLDAERPVRLHLLGQDSQALRDHNQRRADRRLQDPMGMRVTAHQLEADDIEVVVVCTAGWENVTVDGKEVEHSMAAVRSLYMRFPWIREQAAAFVANRANFLPASSSS